MILNSIAGHDPKDCFSARVPVPDYQASLDGEVRGTRIGIVREMLYNEFVDQQVMQAVKDAASLFEHLGALVDEISLPLIRIAPAVKLATADAEEASFHRKRLAMHPLDYDPGIRYRLLAASLLPVTLYHKGQQAWKLLRDEVLQAFERFDVILGPTTATTAPRIKDANSPNADSKGDASLGWFPNLLLNAAFALAGNPAISIPCGFSKNGLPIGLQLAGRPFDESAVLRAAYAYESNTAWHTRQCTLP